MKAAGLMSIFGGMCFYCRHPVKPHAAHPTDRATIDHDIPKCRMVASVIKNNLVLACHDCNLHKGDMTGNEFIQFRRDRKFPASYIEFLEARLAGKLRL